MGEIKREFRYFTIMEYEEEQEYLRKMHKRGWKFNHVSFPGIYHFKKCEPEDVIYQLDYNKDGISNKEEYVKMFQDCGWEYLLDFVGYSYFRKPVSEMKEEEEIFNDDNSKLEMLQRVYKGRMLPLMCIFCGIICPQLINFAVGDFPYGNIIFGLYVVMFALYTVVFIKCGLKYRELKQRKF